MASKSYSVSAFSPPVAILQTGYKVDTISAICSNSNVCGIFHLQPFGATVLYNSNSVRICSNNSPSITDGSGGFAGSIVPK